MSGYLRQSTTATVKLGPFLAPSDGLTVYTTAGFTAKVGANGGALAARHDATAISYDADGYFAVELDANDTAAVGRLKIEVPGSAGNYLPVWDEFVVLSGAVYDVLFGASAPSTYAGADTAGTTTLLSRIGSAITVAGGKVAATLGSGDYAGNTVQTGDSFGRIGATGSGLTSLAPAATALSAATWTNTRAGNLDNLDAAVSTRSTYAGGDTAGTTTLLSRINSALTISAGKVAATLGGTDYAGNTVQTGDAFARIGATGGGLTTLATASALTSLSTQVGTPMQAGSVTVGTNNDKAGYSLASTGLDAISTAATTGPATTFPAMGVQVWRRFFKKTTKATSGTTIKTYADDTTTVLTTQTFADDGAGNETLGAAS